jgi:hypothetical protein
MSKKSFDDVVAAQEIFGSLDFTLDSSGYSKVYAIGSKAYYKLTPVFDRGLVSDQTYGFVGFQGASQELIPVAVGVEIPWDKFPVECMSDISSIIAALAPGVFMVKKPAVYIITAQCGDCALHVNSFIHLKGATQCLKCAGID